MTIICVGGAGFIGSHLTDRLVKDGHEISVIDNLSTGKFKNLEKSISEITFINGDIRDLDLLMEKFKGIDVVFHTAALARVQPSIKDPIKWNENNITGTLNVLWAAAQNKVKRVIYSASSSAYGNQKKMPLIESMIPNPMSPYALQKLVGEMYCKLFSDIYGLETVCLRYFNVYGERQTELADGPYATVIGVFLGQKKKGMPLTIIGDGTQSRDFTYVDDIVEANIRAMKTEMVGKGETINIGKGDDQSINKIADLIDPKGKRKYLPKRIEPKKTLASNEKCKELLGFKPETTIEEVIKKWDKINK